jgi:hypothetical protein
MTTVVTLKSMAAVNPAQVPPNPAQVPPNLATQGCVGERRTRRQHTAFERAMIFAMDTCRQGSMVTCVISGMIKA